jgi:hypothetical protein
VSQICNLTTVELSISTTLFVKKDAPMVEVMEAGGANAFLTYLLTREVLPTPWEPSTTIFASMLLLMTGEGSWGRESVRLES